MRAIRSRAAEDWARAGASAITAHQSRLLAALGGMELAQEAMRTVDPVVKALAGIKTAMLIGCPF